jgi:hypothetical protein
MYIPRYVIDANQINTRRTIVGMNELERLHDLKVIELLCTSTMNIDLRGERFQEKAKKYRRIGSAGPYHFAKNGKADATWGAPPRDTRIYEIHNIVFGTPIPKNNKDGAIIRSMRDALHLDQCWSNMIDVFITDEKRIIESRKTLYERGFDFQILDADECMEFTHENLQRWYGSTEDQDITKRLKDLSRPILIGSNSTAAISISIGEEKPLFALQMGLNFIQVEAHFRDKSGAPLLSVLPNRANEYHQRTVQIGGARTNGDVGIKLGKNYYDRCSIGSTAENRPPFWNPLDEVLLAAFVARSGHVVFYAGIFRDSEGYVRSTITKESLELVGASLSFRDSNE